MSVQFVDTCFAQLPIICLLFLVPNRANEEIAQVRAKANSESVALSASLRKEQMRVESLERAVLQKVRAVSSQGSGFSAKGLKAMLKKVNVNVVCKSGIFRLLLGKNRLKSSSLALGGKEEDY